MQTTWTTDGRKHIARNGNMIIGRITELQCKTDEPFEAVSANGMRKRFLLLFHAKEWIEEIGFGIGESDGIE